MTLLITHPACLEHLTPPGHPERPERLRVIERVLEHEKFMFLLREQCQNGRAARSAWQCRIGSSALADEVM
jgi:acetoin utilization deacetylase AcuC-like enzyme